NSQIFLKKLSPIAIRFEKNLKNETLHRWVKKKKVSPIPLTFGEVAAANKGRRPPQAITRLSTSCEIICTVFTTNTAFSLSLAWSIKFKLFERALKKECLHKIFDGCKVTTLTTSYHNPFFLSNAGTMLAGSSLNNVITVFNTS
uniref:Uncharacterized protein n=1 Tax=Romanomermis culicivorax TaxID=13658 RepID=A0A915KAU4_ROMCU